MADAAILVPFAENRNMWQRVSLFHVYCMQSALLLIRLLQYFRMVSYNQVKQFRVWLRREWLKPCEITDSLRNDVAVVHQSLYPVPVFRPELNAQLLLQFVLRGEHLRPFRTQLAQQGRNTECLHPGYVPLFSLFPTGIQYLLHRGDFLVVNLQFLLYMVKFDKCSPCVISHIIPYGVVCRLCGAQSGLSLPHLVFVLAANGNRLRDLHIGLTVISKVEPLPILRILHIMQYLYLRVFILFRLCQSSLGSLDVQARMLQLIVASTQYAVHLVDSHGAVLCKTMNRQQRHKCPQKISVQFHGCKITAYHQNHQTKAIRRLSCHIRIF